MKQLFLIVNEDRFFLSHRKRVAQMAMQNGWDVTIVTKNTGLREEIEKIGLKYIELPVNPTGMKPTEELKTLKFLYGLFKENPDALIHLVGLKTMLWGGLASRMTRTKGVVYAVSGLGTLYGENSSGMLTKIIEKFLKIGLNHKNVGVIFQNHDDEKLFTENGLLGDCYTFFIKGSGVNLDKFKSSGRDKGNDDGETLKIIFTARMLREKGVEDLIEAAELLRKDYEGKIEFLLCGGLSSNPNALKEGDLKRLTDDKYIKWLGHRNDINILLEKSSIICFPSYYREGVPKSLLEASAAGLPIITTDSVGCKDTVIEGRNGILVKPHSPKEIAEAIKKLVEDPELRLSMGNESRKIAEEQYDVEKVASMHLDIYNILNAEN